MRNICARRSLLSSCRSSERFRSVRSCPGRKDISGYRPIRSAVCLPERSSRSWLKDILIYQPFWPWSSLLRIIPPNWIDRRKGSVLDWRKTRHSIFITRPIWTICDATGAELVEFSPLHDSKLPPDLDGLIIGGGFPEVFADELAQNQSIRSEIHSAIEDGLACYAECGGLMWLAEELVCQSGRHFPMVGVHSRRGRNDIRTSTVRVLRMLWAGRRPKRNVSRA